MDLSSLSPEEIEELKAALADPPKDPIKITASALELLASKVEAIEAKVDAVCKIEAKVDAVCKVVYDDFIGGIKELADGKARSDRIGGLKSKYGSLFSGPGYPEYLGDHLEGNPDGIYDLLDEHLAKLREGEGYTDEIGESEIQKIAKEIGDRVAKITGKPVAVETNEITAEPEKPKEEPKAEEKPPIKEEEDPMAKLKKHIGGLKERGGQAA